MGKCHIENVGHFVQVSLYQMPQMDRWHLIQVNLLGMSDHCGKQRQAFIDFYYPKQQAMGENKSYLVP